MLEDDPKVVVRAVPSKAAEEVFTNPVPLIVTAVSFVPTTTDDGTSPEMDGTGLFGSVTVITAEPDFVESWVEVALTVSNPEAGTVVGAL